jgi:hypothetical protein
VTSDYWGWNWMTTSDRDDGWWVLLVSSSTGGLGRLLSSKVRPPAFAVYSSSADVKPSSVS